jgi:2,3-bisphosphoglycerate-independent phosphoglycerate mutase
MKYIIFLGDGMADYPVPELDRKTPLMVARKPGMDWIAQHGRTGLFQTIGPEMLTGSAIANLSVLGYDPIAIFHGSEGRGVLEAASLGIELSASDLALRINLICVEEGKIRSHSSGHISNPEAHSLIHDLQEHLAHLGLKLYPGLSYRHVLVVPQGSEAIECAPPHDHIGELFSSLMVQPREAGARASADLLNRLILESQAFLANHPVNEKRRTSGKQAANSLWPWAPGKRPQMQTFQERFGIRGAAITAVDLVKGLAIYAGMDPISVEGATGLYDTNYEGKADACLKALETHDFVYVHVEAADEAGHERDLQLKIRCIEDLDARLIQRVMAGLKAKSEEVVLAILPDHPTPVAHGCHTREAVPVAIYSPAAAADSVSCFDEESVKAGSLGLMRGSTFIETVFGRI